MVFSAYGYRIARRRIARLMRKQGLRPKQKTPLPIEPLKAVTVAPHLLLRRPAPG